MRGTAPRRRAMETFRKALLVLLLAGGAAFADRPPLQSDLDHCTLATQSGGREAKLQGTVRLQKLIPPDGKPHAAVVWSERGVNEPQPARSLSNLPLLWALAPSAPGYAWPHP